MRYLLKKQSGMSENDYGTDDPKGFRIAGQTKPFIVPGRSILKHNSIEISDDRENLTTSNIPSSVEQLGGNNIAEGNNTTSKINTVNLQSKLGRRVSFAPDVTLHRFDFVPQESVNFKEPRRKTSNFASVSLDGGSSQSNDDAASVLHGGEKESEISAPKPNSENEAMVRAQSSRADLGTFSETVSSAEHELISDQEVSMEITQLFSKHSAKPENKENKFTIQGNEPGASIVGNNDDSNSIASSAQQNHPESDSDESMDITALQRVVLNENNMNITESQVDFSSAIKDRASLNHIEALDEDGSDVSLTHSGHLHGLRQVAEETMEITKLHSPRKAVESFPKSAISSQSPDDQERNDKLEFRPSQMITSTQQSLPQKSYAAPKPNQNSSKHPFKSNSEANNASVLEVQSKRRKLNNGNIVEEPLRERSPNKKEGKATDEDLDFTVMERLSPIGLHDSSISRSKPLISDHVQITRELGPVTSDPEQLNVQNNRDAIEPISLQKFLTETGVNFTLENDISENLKTVKFDYLGDRDQCSASKVYDSLYADMPMLEIYAFCCKELIRRIRESKKLFKELERQVSESIPPLLFTEYFKSGSSVRKLMNEQIHLVKSYSRLEAKKVWYEWRSQHLRGIKSVLKENAMILKEEEDSITKHIKEATKVKNHVSEIKQALLREVSVAKEAPSCKSNVSNLQTRLRLEKMKEELKKNNINAENVDVLKTEYEKLKETISELSRKIADVKSDISAQSTNIKKHKLYTEHDYQKLQRTFATLEKLCGIQLLKFTGTKLTIDILVAKVQFEFDLTRLSDVKEVCATISDLHDDFGKILCKRLIREHLEKASDVFSFVKGFHEGFYASLPLIKEFKNLSTIFPTRLANDFEVNELFEIRLLDTSSKFKILCYLSLNDFINAVQQNHDNETKLRANIVYGQDITEALLKSHIKRRIGGFLPWLNSLTIDM